MSLQEDLESLSQEERRYLAQIMAGLGKGDTSSLNNLWSADYIEKPVDVVTFMTDDDYLGKSLKDDNGNLTVYPYWVERLQIMFNDSPDNIIQEVALSGCIGSGKSTCAVIGLAYSLYKLLCLRSPTSYYNLNKSSKIALAFFNVTLAQSYGVGYSRLQLYCKASPWFCRHGQILGRTTPTYYPDGIEIIVGSKKEHFIGRDIFCLSQGTLIPTEHGIMPIEDLEDNPQRVFTFTGQETKITDKPVYAVCQGETKELLEIELENGTIIRCTPDHKFLTKNGEWTEAEKLKETDDLQFFPACSVNRH